jgi:hypothetical protein
MRVEFSACKLTFPQVCACCGRKPDAVFTAAARRSEGVKVERTETNTWDFPYCSACLAHVRTAKWANRIMEVGATLNVLVGLALWFAVKWWVGLIAVLALTAVEVWLHLSARERAQGMRCQTCAAVDQAVDFKGWDGPRQIFEIACPVYTVAFMVANEDKLVNVSPAARKLFEDAGHVLDPISPQSAKREMK